MWVWHRKMTAENQGLALIKAGHQGALCGRSAGQLAGPYRSRHAQAHQGPHQRGGRETTWTPSRPWRPARKIIPLDDSPQGADRGPPAIRLHDPLDRRPPPAADAHLRPERADGRRRGQGAETGRRLRDQLPQGRNPGNPNCFLFPLTNGGWRVYRFSPGVSEADTWSQDGQGWTTCYFNRRPDLATAAKTRGGIEDPDKGGYTFKTPDDAMQVAKALGQDEHRRGPDVRRTARPLLKPHKDGRLVMEIERKKGDAELNGAGRLARQEDEVGPRLRDHHRRQEGRRPRADRIRQPHSRHRDFRQAICRLGGPQERRMDRQPGHQRQNAAAKPRQRQGRRGVHHGRRSRQELAAGQPSLPRRVSRRPAMEPGRRAVPSSSRRPWNPTRRRMHPHWDMIFEHIGIELTPALRRPALGATGQHQDRGRLLAGVGGLRLPRSLRADALPLPVGQREQRQEHPPRGPAACW